MDIQTEVQKIHHQYGVSEKANYEIQKLFDKSIKEAVTEALRIHNVVGQSEQFSLADMKEAYEAGENNAGSYTYPPFEEWFSKR